MTRYEKFEQGLIDGKEMEFICDLTKRIILKFIPIPSIDGDITKEDDELIENVVIVFEAYQYSMLRSILDSQTTRLILMRSDYDVYGLASPEMTIYEVKSDHTLLYDSLARMANQLLSPRSKQYIFLSLEDLVELWKRNEI